MKYKEHKLKTIKDILEVVNKKNVEAFLKDFTEWLHFTLEIKKAVKFIEKEGVEVSRKYQDEMIWIDDGKNEGTIRFEINTK